MSGGILCLTGGIGGAKLALGLHESVAPEQLMFAVNPGDDFNHLGVEIWPDFDTLIYTLADIANQEAGWGRQGESWHFQETIEALGGPGWFRLGDRDLALHVLRTEALRQGVQAGELAERLVTLFGVRSRAIPAAAGQVRTWIDTEEGCLAFQDYFVRRRAEPRVKRIEYRCSGPPGLALPVLNMMASPSLRGVIIAPSNPWLSIAPILALEGCETALTACRAPTVAVTPIIAGASVKGPTAKIMAELGLEVSPLTIAEQYSKFIDGFVLDSADAHLAPAIAALGIECLIVPTLMRDRADKVRLAQSVVGFVDSLSNRSGART